MIESRIGNGRNSCSLFVVICCLFLIVSATATSEIYPYCHTRSQHDSLPIWPLARDERIVFGKGLGRKGRAQLAVCAFGREPRDIGGETAISRSSRPKADRKSTRLNSSH